jgi:hypothetical protein
MTQVSQPLHNDCRPYFRGDLSNIRVVVVEPVRGPLGDQVDGSCLRWLEDCFEKLFVGFRLAISRQIYMVSATNWLGTHLL